MSPFSDAIAMISSAQPTPRILIPIMVGVSLSVQSSGAFAASNDCFAGDLPKPVKFVTNPPQEPRCWTVHDFVLDAVFSSRDDHRPSLIATGSITKVHALPGSLFERAEVLAEFQLNRPFLFPGESAPRSATLVLRSDLFEWQHSGVSRYLFRTSILPHMIREATALDRRIHTMDERYNKAGTLRIREPGFFEYHSTRPFLAATRDWIVANYPRGTLDWLSPDGTTLNQPPTSEGHYVTEIWPGA